jgi:hypothetical protein
VTDVLLPIELYPENAVINLMIPTTDLVGVESGIQHIFWEDSGSFYLSNFTITRFGTINKAIDNYNIRTSLRLAEAHFLHQDLTFQGQGADEYIIGCGTSRFGTNYECAMVARYEEFVITIYTYIKEPVSETTFNEMAVFLDSELAELISR